MSLQGLSTATISLVASEIVHHARTALEYVVYNLAWLDSGRPRKGTQFPILDDSSKWREAKKRRLRGLNEAHAGFIHRYQPFSDCAWTGKLRDLSNTDKHQFLVETMKEFGGTFRINPADAEPDPNDSTRVLLRYPIDVATIRLSDESEVNGTLTEICRGVAVLLDELQSDFGEDDALELR